MRGPDSVNLKLSIGVIDVDDIAQVFKPDVNILGYFMPTQAVEHHPRDGVRFENLLESPAWTPKFDFTNEVEEVLVTDESYWYDTDTGLVFFRVNLVPTIQDRFDHSRFPFDRQTLDCEILSNSVTFEPFEATEFPPELRMHKPDWQIECKLAAMADAWDLHDVSATIHNDSLHSSSKCHVQVMLERSSDFYVWNIGFVYALIIGAQTMLLAFPFNESRFDFAMQLALTTVAFKLVTSSMVPKTSYFTTLDTFMITGLVMLAFRFIGDFSMLLAFDVPVGEEGYRGKCEDSDDITICDLDLFLTLGLSAVWIGLSVFYLTFGKLVLRPSWDSVNRLSNEASSISFEIKGKTSMSMDDIHNDEMVSIKDMDE